MSPVIEDIGEKKIIGIGAPFISILSPDRNNMVVIPKLWETFVGRANEITSRTPGVTMGVCADLPEGITRTHEHEFFYTAGAEVETLDSIPEGMTGISIPAGLYARFTHKGRIDDLGRTIGFIYEEWLPGSGCRRRDGAAEIEIYDHRFDPASEESEMEIWVPVER